MYSTSGEDGTRVEHYTLVPWMVSIEPTKENELSKKSVIDLFQVRSVSQQVQIVCMASP